MPLKPARRMLIIAYEPSSAGQVWVKCVFVWAPPPQSMPPLSVYSYPLSHYAPLNKWLLAPSPQPPQLPSERVSTCDWAHVGMTTSSQKTTSLTSPALIFFPLRLPCAACAEKRPAGRDCSLFINLSSATGWGCLQARQRRLLFLFLFFQHAGYKMRRE